MADDDFVTPQGRRTIRRSVPNPLGNPMVPQDGRQNRNIRMWTIGDGKPGSTKEKLRQVYHNALADVDRMGAHKSDAARSGKFTEAGLSDEALGFAASELAPSFKRGRVAIEKARAEAAALRDKIKRQPANPGDIVGALRRREIRDHLKAMPDKERNAYISKNRANMDADMALAIVEMPAAFSGDGCPLRST